MSITKSFIIEDMPQADGRRSVRERHVFEDGSIEDVAYLAEREEDCEAMLPERAKQIEQRIIDEANAPKPEPMFLKSEIEAAFVKVAPAVDVALLAAELTKGGK